MRTTLLAASGFDACRVDIDERSREFIREWMPGSGAENYVVSARIEAVKPGAAGYITPSRRASV